MPLRRSSTHVRTGERFSAGKRASEIALVALFCGAIGIAFAPIFVRLSEAGPSATAFYRLLFALPALALWWRLEDRRSDGLTRPAGAGDYLGLVLAGLFFAGDLAFWHWSIRFTSVANATLLANFAPIFVAFAGFAFFGERFSRTFLIGLAMALVGACVLMGQSVTVSRSHLFGDALGIITAMFYGAYIVTVGRLRSRMTTSTIMFGSGVVTCVVLLPVAMVSGEDLIAVTAFGWAILVALALVSHAGGQSLIAYALAHLPAAFGSVALLLQPAVAALLAWLILGEALGVWEIAGATVILVGIFLARKGSRRGEA